MLAKDFFADVRAGVNREPTPTADPFRGGTLSYLRTDGDYSGLIKVRNIAPPSADPPAQHFGVLVAGDMLAPIEVEYTVRGADIMAASFPEPITIGIHLQGSVVAINSGEKITHLTVGRGVDDGDGNLVFPPNTAAYTHPMTGYELGMIGGDNLAPKDDAIRYGGGTVWFGPTADACGNRWGSGFYLGSVDSVIRASRIDHVSIRTMCQGSNKKNQPRIDAPSIGTCIVDYLVAGLIWSGQVDFNEDCLDEHCSTMLPSQMCVDDQAFNNYASIESLTIRQLGRYGRVWFHNCPRTDFLEAVWGEIHVDTLAPSEQIWIGDKLGQPPPDTEGQPYFPPPDDGRRDLRVVITSFFNEQSSRADRIPNVFGTPQRGGVYIHDQLGPGGQVIINGALVQNTDSPTSWEGDVVVGFPQVALQDLTFRFEPEILFRPENLQPDLSPYYYRSSSDIGGGAVGLAPFRIHTTDCTPKYLESELLAGSGVFEQAFLSTTDIPVVIRHYGPVSRSPYFFAWSQALRIECRPLVVPTGQSACNWLDVTGAFDLFGPNAGPPGGQVLGARDIGVCCRTTQTVRAGIFRVQGLYDDDLLLGVRCDDVLGSPAAVWQKTCENESAEAPGYLFRVIPDCNSDGVDDEVLDPPPGDECSSECHVADFNLSGSITVQDLFDFLTAYFANCGSTGNPAPGCGRSADVNASGTITVQDIFGFLAAFFTCRE